MSPVLLGLTLALLAGPGPAMRHRFAAALRDAPAPAGISGPQTTPRPGTGRPDGEHAGINVGQDRLDHWFAEDKLRHFTMSFALATVGYGVGRTVLSSDAALAASGAAAIAAGVGKEMHDRWSGHRFSFKDLTWDAAGVALGLTLALQIH